MLSLSLIKLLFKWLHDRKAVITFSSIAIFTVIKRFYQGKLYL